MKLDSKMALCGAIGLVAAAAACGSSTGGQGGGGGSTATGTGGTGTTTSSTATSSSSSGTTTQSGAGGGCHGDEAQWATLTAGPIACTLDSECCVIVNGCTNEAQIVSKNDQAAAKTAWPYCDNGCTNCIPPAIQVGCDNGTCVGTVVPFPDASPDLLMDHCGVDKPIGATLGKLHFTCGG